MSEMRDKVREAIRLRMEAGPFRLRDLRAEGERLRLRNGDAHRLATQAIKDMRAKGAIVFEGSPRLGVWTLLPPEEWGQVTAEGLAAMPAIPQPHVAGQYDPPAALEGANNGLTEAFAEFLWSAMTDQRDIGYTMKASVPPMEARGWRRLSQHALEFLFRLGMVGPGGTVGPDDKWTYAWVYEALNWEIVDADGNGVALVLNDANVPMMMAAPRMAAAIQAMLARVETAGGIKRSDLDALRASLPGANPEPDAPTA